jgi:CubicO group peptidase (beta-lactamase class C family)
MGDWEVPGLALGVVKDGVVVMARGYGVRKAGDPAPVDEHTLFAIGSCTKSFTATALGMLVDEGKVGWDDPVTKHLPRFQLHDPYATREITVRDLLCHRSGVGGNPLYYFDATLSRDEILRRFRYLPPTSGFRSRYEYQNLLYLAAGQIVPSVTGKTWDDFVRDRIFLPLGMRASNTSVTALPPGGNLATPHYNLMGPRRPVSWMPFDHMAPSASINSNVMDMTRWMQLQLGQGTYDKKQLLLQATVREMHTPQMVMPLEGDEARVNPLSHFMTSGLGWVLQDYRGRKVVSHSGGTSGMTSVVAMVPEEGLGVVVLVNVTGSVASLTTAVQYRVFDAFLGAPPRDWSAELLKVGQARAARRREAAAREEGGRIRGTKPSLPLDHYPGTYTDELYGEVKVTRQQGRLVLRYGTAVIGDLEHWHYDTFRATWKEPFLPKGLVTFHLNARGKVEDVRIEVPGLDPLAARRTPSPDRG